MTGNEDQADAIVVNLFARNRAECRFVAVDGGMCLQLAPDLGVLGRHRPVPAKRVDGPAFPHGDEPRSRVLWSPVARPLAERVHQRVLSKLFGQSDIASEGGQHRDHSGELEPVDRLDPGS